MLYIVNGIGNIYIARAWTDSKAVINGIVVGQEGAHRHTVGRNVHLPHIVVEPIYLILRAIELYLRGPIAKVELEAFLHLKLAIVYIDTI